MALQLVACGNAMPVGHERAQHETARPARAADVASEASVVAAASPHMGGSVARSAGPEATPESEPIATPEAGWEAARCAGAATRRIRIAGNCDAGLGAFVEPFDAAAPQNTASLGTTFDGFDDQGRRQSVSVYFVPLEQGWDYHAVMDGTAFIVGEGHLSFDERGIATVEVRQALRLLTASGPGRAVELDLSGMTRLDAVSTFFELDVDGSEARWGRACATPEPLPDEAVSGPHCAAAATTRFTLRANLAPATPVANEPWDPLAPSVDFTLPLQGNDANGALIDFDLRLRRSSAETWDYHVLLLGAVPGLEVASGSLHFNSNGSLRSVTTTRPLRFPNHDGVLGDAIELDFGANTAVGGSGVDGVTALPGGSFEVWEQRDGGVLDCLPRAPTNPLPVSHPPSCAGEHTTAVRMGFNLDPATALNFPVPYSTSVEVYDAALTPRQLELRFKHLEARHWQCQVIASSAKVGIVDLYFTATGAPELIENIPTLRLPRADGSVGPPILLAFDDNWAFTSYSITSQGWLAPNGAAPDAHGCVK